MEEKIITKENLIKLSTDLVNEGFNVIAPSEKGYTLLQTDPLLSFTENTPLPKSPFKEYLFPKTEPLFYYKKGQHDYEFVDVNLQNVKNIFLAAKPCDAASVNILSKVFNWDYKDEFFDVRADNSLVISMACSTSDEYCFCTSVGLSPVSTKGADLFMIPLAGDKYAIRIVTDKGKSFTEKYSKYFSDGNSDESEKVLAGIKAPEKSFDTAKVKDWLDKNFESEFWNGIAATCLACGQCAFSCPVCHCFDIVDEDYSYKEGRRMKNWDACQFGLFTEHASGHNPRENQAKRYRQRISHKFKYYKDKFDEVLCTGCGRCTRGCPVSIDIKEIVTEINNLN